MSRDAVTIVCLASYEKGQALLRACAEAGARPMLLTVEALENADWPRSELAAMHVLPSLNDRAEVLRTIDRIARSERVHRVVPLDEFDLEMASEVRRHLCLPGLDCEATSRFRDKLAMRFAAAAAGVSQPEFTPALPDADVAEYIERVPPPWFLKPRGEAATEGIRRVESAEELWRALDVLGDGRGFHLIERYVPGQVFHVDGIVAHGQTVFVEAHAYGQTPFSVMREGGLFISSTLPRDGAETAELSALVSRIATTFGLRDGAFHAEFIRDGAGRFRFLEIAARVGGAHIAELVEAATGINLWAEWALLEVAAARGQRYSPPSTRRDHAGILICLARQEWPDTAAYDAPEVVWRLRLRHHAGIIVASPGAERVRELLDRYAADFQRDFLAVPPSD